MADRITPAARADMARDYFLQGYGCTQAVLLAFSDLTGLDRDTAARLGSSFGGGMGRMREVCGAVSGALMVLGLVCGYSDPTDKEGKNAHYALVREFAARYKAENGADSIVCREILAGVPHTDGGTAEERTADYYKKRPCPDLCALAARITQEMVDEMRE